MGNHEFCEFCHENDFHRGSPCNPVKKAAVDAHKAELAREKRVGMIELKKLQDRLAVEGYPSHFDFDGNLVLWPFAVARERHL
jgi:hypothetical protein